MSWGGPYFQCVCNCPPHGSNPSVILNSLLLFEHTLGFPTFRAFVWWLLILNLLMDLSSYLCLWKSHRPSSNGTSTTPSLLSPHLLEILKVLVWIYIFHKTKHAVFNMIVIFVSYHPNKLNFLKTLALILVVPTTLNNCFIHLDRIYFNFFFIRTSKDLELKQGRINITMFWQLTLLLNFIPKFIENRIGFFPTPAVLEIVLVLPR